MALDGSVSDDRQSRQEREHEELHTVTMRRGQKFVFVTPCAIVTVMLLNAVGGTRE